MLWDRSAVIAAQPQNLQTKRTTESVSHMVHGGVFQLFPRGEASSKDCREGHGRSSPFSRTDSFHPPEEHCSKYLPWQLPPWTVPFQNIPFWPGQRDYEELLQNWRGPVGKWSLLDTTRQVHQSMLGHFNHFCFSSKQNTQLQLLQYII